MLSLNREYYRGYADIPISRLEEIENEGQLAWFIKDYRGQKDVFLTPDETRMLTDRFHAIYDERLEFTGNHKLNSYFRVLEDFQRLKAKLSRLETTFVVIKLAPYTYHKWHVLVNEFDLEGDNFKWHKVVESDEERTEYFKFLERQIAGVKNKYNLMCIKYEEASEFKKGKKGNIFETKIVLQKELGINFIDMDRVSAKEWDTMCMQIQNKNKPDG